MTVHMFRCYIGRGSMSVTDLETRINDWVSKNGEWVDDTEPHVLVETNTKNNGSGTTFHTVDVRFEKTYTKSNLFTKFTDKLQDKVAWYRVGYHACTHRDGDGSSGGCTFDANQDPSAAARDWTAKDVTIPGDVPTLPESAYNNTM